MTETGLEIGNGQESSPERKGKDSLQLALNKYYRLKAHWDRLDKERKSNSFRSKVRKLFDEGLMIGVPLQTQVSMDLSDARSEVETALKERAGTYPLSDITWEARPSKTGKPHFEFHFSWVDKTTGEEFQPYYSKHDLTVKKSEGDSPQLETRPGEEPVLHLPQGFNIPLVSDYKTTYYTSEEYHAAWQPDLSDVPTRIKIPDTFEIPFKLKMEDIVPFTATQVVS